MENHIIAHALELLGHTNYVIRGETNSEETFNENVKIIIDENEVSPNISYEDFLVEYETATTSFNLIELRFVRNKLLRESDWTQFSDVSSETKALWEPYRQALRDITETYTSLDDVVWSEKPEE
jgi:hypothetical protein